jgi:hypothetical protein
MPGTLPGTLLAVSLCMSGHTDPDSLVDADAVFALALALNQAMNRDAAARARYRAMWGVEWSPLPTAGGIDYFPMPVEETESTLARTIR